ncbi:hypothetical protein MASR2M54_26010 [Aliarcobacter cryaerophilus]
MISELTGLSKDAQFKLKDGALTKAVAWDETSSKWTITGAECSYINKSNLWIQKLL